MGKSSYRLIFFISIVIVSSLLFIPSSFAAVLRWSPVESNETCVVVGYKVHYGTAPGQYTSQKDVGAATSCDLGLLNLLPSVIYYFSVNAYSIANKNGPLSPPIAYNDADNDRMPDDWEANYGINNAFSDPDLDGLDNITEYFFGTSPIDDDSDDDGMDDGWEMQNDLDPLLDDANDDIDGDGDSNLEEFNNGTGVLNRPPEKPELSLPGNFFSNVALRPLLKTAAFVDYEGNAHTKTKWQISSEQAFNNSGSILFELETYDALTSLTVPEFILDPGKIYYWRVRFFDVLNGKSIWSDPFAFTTMVTNPEDPDDNGVPDNIEVMDGTIDLNGDGSLDLSSNAYKLVSYGMLSIGLEGSNRVKSVICLKTIDPNTISESFGKPNNLDFGLIQFKINVDNPGDTADVVIYFSEPVGNQWYKYDLINGWREYSKDYPNNVQFSADRKSVRLKLMDGGPGDSDGVANGIIVDPSGPGGLPSSAVSGGSGGGGDGGGGGCFIATAAFGSPVEKHVQVLKDFRDIFLLKSNMRRAFVTEYYKYFPPVADVIAENSNLRASVRVGLIPLIVFSYVIGICWKKYFLPFCFKVL